MEAARILLMIMLGAAIALLVGRNARFIGSTLGLMDHPDGAGGRKQHARVTPLVGGIAILVAVLLAGTATVLSAGLSSPDVDNLIWLLVAVASLWVIGAIDDRWHLSPLLRLGAAATVLGLTLGCTSGFDLAELAFPSLAVTLDLGAFGFGFSLLCLVGLLNAVNMADGKNGVVIGMSLIWTWVLAGHAGPALLPVLAALGGALAVTFAFNMAGRLFLGDGGSYAVSALFGLLALYSYNQGTPAMGAADVATLFAVPVFDTVRLIFARMARGQSPFAGDRDHLHHYLHARFGWPHGLSVYLALVGVPNFGALLLPGTGLGWLCLTLAAYLAAINRFRLPAPQLAE